MLQELHVTNFALIDHLDLAFGAGLNILTGETGAGKSIIIDALGLALGERASGADLVRTGAQRATVEAVFDLAKAPDEVRARLAEAGLESDEDDDTLLVSRELARGSGKSQCRINGRLMPVSVLKEIAQGLVDVHGQHEHQSLLASERHVDILDNWCGKDALALREEVAGLYARANALKREREKLRTDARERERMLDLYRFQQEEIFAAALKPGEEDEMLADRSRLANAEKLSAASAEGYELLSGGERGAGALDALNDALASVENAAALDESLQPVLDALQGAVSYAEDAAHALRDYREGVEFNPERLEEIESRLDLLRTLKRKYGDTVEEILTYAEELLAKLDRLENSAAREDELTAAMEKTQAELTRLAARLTKARQKGSENFAQGIARELGDLGMAATKFEVALEPQTVTAKGADRVEFLLSPNPGEPLRPLAKIASGGEMSRIMLAMKSVMAKTGAIPTMIFDEIDVGVGGRTAQVIADKLDALAGDAQILCITHLPQIASRADTHFFIEKHVEGERTVVSVCPLDAEARVDEIVRMLGGSSRSETVTRHAREMLGHPAL
ncbi:MAG: DNA repair protein RecN [Armatimonadota bacterium]|nr:DNA repair protein RecN [Armatimonadota bacterium]